MVMQSLVFVLLGFVSVVSLAEGETLSKQSIELKSAMTKIESDHGKSFATWFPKDKTEFNRICNNPKHDELSDCHDIIQEGAGKTLRLSPEILGSKVSKIVSELEFDADAPSYLQTVWVEFCTQDPSAFVEAVEKLSPSARKRSFKYMTRGIEHDDNEKLDRCIDSLTSAKRLKAARWAKSARTRQSVDHH
jgi:hypothetical protein